MTANTSLFLDSLHQELGATIKAYAGFMMPMHYPDGILVEHCHTRQHAGFFDLSHMGQLAVYGDQAQPQLNKLVPSDLSSLYPGQQKYTVLTNESGGILDDIVIIHLGHYLLVVTNALNRQKIHQHFKKHFTHSTRIEALTENVLLALQGPEAASILAQANSQITGLSFMQAKTTELYRYPCIVSRSGYTGEDGFEIIVHQQYAMDLTKSLLSEKNVKAIGLAARNTLRLEAGLCLYGNELSEQTTPLDAGLAWLVQDGKSSYPGSDVLLSQFKSKPNWQRTGLLIDSKIPVRDQTKVFNEYSQEVGYVTSGSFSPCLNQPIAMAMINTSPDVMSNSLYAQVRNQKIPLKQTSLPFIKHKYFRPKRS